MISREDIVVQSVQDFIRDELDARGYTADKLEVLDAYDTTEFDGPLDKQYVALGFGFDDGGRQAELGSDLRTRTYNIEFYTFATDAQWGRNIASLIRDLIDAQERGIPLKDYNQAAGDPDNAPVVDYLQMAEDAAGRGARAERVTVVDPKPYQQFAWLTQVRVSDTYYASQVV